MSSHYTVNVLCVCQCTDIEMPFTGREKVCIGACSITVQQDCAACICEGVGKTVANINADLDMTQKFQSKGCLCRRIGYGRQKSAEEIVRCVRVKIVKRPKKLL